MKKLLTIMSLLIMCAISSYGQRIWQPRNEISITAGKYFEDDEAVVTKIEYTHYTKSNFGFGVGSGVWFYDADCLAFPLSVHASYSYPTKYVSPYAQLGIGGVFAIADEAAGVGFFYNPEIGVKVPILKWLAFKVNLNYFHGFSEGSVGSWGFNAGITFGLGKRKGK